MNRLGGTQRESNPLRLNIARVHVPLTAVLAAWTARKTGQLLGRGLRWVLRHPRVLTPLLPWWGLTWLLDGPSGGASGLGALGVLIFAVVLFLVLGLVGWWVWERESFTRLVAWRCRGWWRSRGVYRYYWQPAMVTAGLAVVVDGREYLPRILSVRSTSAVDRVAVRMLPGQVAEDWTAVGPRLAQTFGAVECRVRSVPGDRRRLELWFLVTDPLTEVVPPLSLG